MTSPTPPACTIKTVEKLTNVRMDEYMVVDFTGFESMVDSLGGVPMYVEEDVDDEKADLHLSKGCNTLNGAQALGYARARYSAGRRLRYLPHRPPAAAGRRDHAHRQVEEPPDGHADSLQLRRVGPVNAHRQ